ncbi:hypothetical protein FSP39_002130 [Pinctada imbricata]|uniref:F-box domain-containing protein n=1 Tax=Pinctada imbricata TaxID=66713 RepID=A0AA89BMR7_PINIB|nr:hypothetical protein FSP39_002130 [Pinctada imbricata]
MSMIAKNRLKSSWTPLSNEETNNKYDKWTDEQRRRVLEDLLNRSKVKQLKFAQEVTNEKVPLIREDFTRELPKAISIHILSFLDPRSLCRCARVCWYWKTLSELDQLWMPKCLRYGWFLPFTPSPYEVGVWKRNYIENIKYIQVLRPRDTALTLERLRLDADEKRAKSRSDKDKKKGVAPWRGSDPNPKDTWRYNVLENDDVVDQVNKIRKKKSYGADVDEISRNARSRVKSGQNILNHTRRSQTYALLSDSAASMYNRPAWATQTAPYVSFDATVMDKNNRNKSRPRSTSPPKPGSRPMTARSERDPPTTQLFPEKPWTVPDSQDSDEEQ